MSECSWSSCREGCTGQPWECHQVYVEFRTAPTVSSSSSMVTRTAPLKISVKGCGYPPAVNCSVWIRDFGQNNSEFPCYYSQWGHCLSDVYKINYKSDIMFPSSPDVPAITHLDLPGAHHDVLVSILVPLLIMGAAFLALILLSNSRLEKLILGNNKTVEK